MSRYLLLFAVFFVIGCGRCDYFTQPQTTYVSPLEKLVILFMRTGRRLEDAFSSTSVGSRLENSTIGNALNPYKDKIKLIFPGTYWCGDGDTADAESELGLFRKTDSCCRNHDHCTTSIDAQSENYGLINNGIFTRSSCDCDREFYDCLKNVSSIISEEIGTTYFNVLRPQCFDNYYPIIGCETYTKKLFVENKCTKYIFNTSAPPKYEWFDNPDFLHL